MELRHLRAFAALAAEGHFGRAAERLHIAQPALSQQVKQLERELGVGLVSRTTRRVELTEAGRRFAEHCHAVLGSVDRASSDMAQVASGQAGRVSVGFIGTATYDLVVLRPDGLDRPAVDLRVLRTERLVAVLPDHHPLAGRARIDLAELAGEPFVMHYSGHRSSMHERVLAACADAGFRPPSITEVGETATLVVFVAAGLGVALVPSPVRSLALAGVAYVELTEPATIDLALATRSGEASPAVHRVAGIVAGLAIR